MKAFYLDFNMSQVSLDNVTQTLARTVYQKGMDELFEEDLMPIIQDDGEGAPKDEHAKSIEDESHPVDEKS